MAQSSEDSYLASLPLELINIIFSLVEQGEDLICLGLTCQYFWALLRDRVKEIVAKDMAPWAGSSLIFLGDYADDLPSSLLTPTLQQELDEATHEKLERCRWDKSYDGDPDDCKVNLYQIAEDWKDPAHRPVFHSASTRLQASEKELLSSLFLNPYPEDQAWVLRNLSKREYVTAQSINEVSGITSTGLVENAIGLGEVIASRIQWTSDPSGTVDGCKGEWAGDRFDITTLDRIGLGLTQHEDTDGREWKDVSEKAAKLVDDIWSEVINREDSRGCKA